MKGWLTALLALLWLAAELSAGEREEFDYALRLQQEGVYDIAVQQCENFRRLYPDSYLDDRVLMIQGECAWELGDWDNARAAWLRLSLNHPESELAPETRVDPGEDVIEEDEDGEEPDDSEE